MSTNVEKAKKKASQMGIQALVKQESSHDKFVSMFQAANNANKQRAEQFYQVEQFHFLKTINESDKLKECNPISLFGCFMDTAINGLSFDPDMKHVSLVPFGKTAKLMISGQGELLQRIRQGQIKHADNPVIVYDCDKIRFGSGKDGAYVEHEVTMPRPADAQPILCYLRITRSDGTLDYKWLTKDELEGLRKFSKQPNSPAWKDGYLGMWKAKTIKHAFKNYPKLRMGNNTVLENDVTDHDQSDFDMSTFGNYDTPEVQEDRNVAPVEEEEVQEAEVVDEDTGEITKAEGKVENVEQAPGQFE